MSRPSRRREPAAVLAILTDWLQQRPGYAGATLHNLERPAGAGLSNETWLFACDSAHGREDFVMQVGPAAAGLFRDYDLGAMACVQQRLAEVSDVPVARVRWYEPDASHFGSAFYVMARVPGRVPADTPPYHGSGWFAELPGATQAAAWQSGIAALARLHALDPARDGFAFLCDAPWGMPLTADPALTRISQWREFLAWGASTRLERYEQALDRLAAERPAVPARLAVHWGDAKLSNCVIDGTEVRALLDWELCGISAPEEDLAFWLLLDWSHWNVVGVPRLPALPDARATVAFYEAASGRAAPDTLWWFKFGLVRLAIIYHRFIARRIELGRLAPDVDAYAANPMSALIPLVLEMERLP